MASVLSLAICIGCGTKPAVEMAPVVGKVSYQGTLLKNGQVVIMDSTGHVSAGEIAADGTYRVEAPVGDVQVAVICRDEPNLSQLDPNVGRPLRTSGEARSLIPERYMSTASSGLSMNVAQGENVQDFKLE
ncbi:MAG: hypothetical protein H0T51_08450 [Pirellulales bacterium]|nr:hypothetical protein [Pirellulales bacterium]